MVKRILVCLHDPTSSGFDFVYHRGMEERGRELEGDRIRRRVFLGGERDLESSVSDLEETDLDRDRRLCRRRASTERERDRCARDLEA